jgi:hypothetical protein
VVSIITSWPIHASGIVSFESEAPGLSLSITTPYLCRPITYDPVLDERRLSASLLEGSPASPYLLLGIGEVTLNYGL